MRKFSLNRFLHNDKLVMILSLALAILIWALVVYGPGNEEDMTVTGVPISITLNEHASQTLNLRIIEGANATATVKVHGLRSVVSKLSPNDITVTADTGSIIKEGTYTLRLHVTAVGDYTVLSVVGNDGASDTVTVTCDVWREVMFPVEAELPNITLEDIHNYQLGEPLVSGVGITDGQVLVCGPKSDVSRIASVVATVEDTATLTDAAVYTAQMVAKDENGDPVENVTFADTENGDVTVTVPVLVHREVTVNPSARNVPEDFQSVRPLITVKPSTVEVWGTPAEADEYITELQQRIQLDFDHLHPDDMTRAFVLDETDSVHPVSGSDMIYVSVALRNMTTRIIDLPITGGNFKVKNCPDGYTVSPTQPKISGITLCGSAADLAAVDLSAVTVEADMASEATPGTQTLSARIRLPAKNGAVWVYYGDTAAGVDVLATVTEK